MADGVSAKLCIDGNMSDRVRNDKTLLVVDAECNLDLAETKMSHPCKYVSLEETSLHTENMRCLNVCPKADKQQGAVVTEQHSGVYKISYDFIESLCKNGHLWTYYIIEKSPGDGHCLMHSIVTSMSSQMNSSDNIDLNYVKSAIMDEITNNSSRYVEAIDGRNLKSLIRGMRQYLLEKKYDTPFGDLVPYIIANALNMNLILIMAGDPQSTLLVKSLTDDDGCYESLVLYKDGAHYDGIVLQDTFDQLFLKSSSCGKIGRNNMHPTGKEKSFLQNNNSTENPQGNTKSQPDHINGQTDGLRKIHNYISSFINVTSTFMDVTGVSCYMSILCYINSDE